MKGPAVVSQARAHRGAAGWTSRRNRPLPFPGQTVTESQVVDLEFLEPGIVAAAPAFEADTATGEGDQAGVSKFCDPAKRFAGIKCRGKYPGGLIVGAECDPQMVAVGDLNQHPERLSAGQKLWKTSFETQVDFLNSRDLIGFDVEEIEKTDSLAGNEFQSGLPEEWNCSLLSKTPTFHHRFQAASLPGGMKDVSISKGGWISAAYQLIRKWDVYFDTGLSSSRIALWFQEPPSSDLGSDLGSGSSPVRDLVAGE